jgi:PhnB protein
MFYLRFHLYSGFRNKTMKTANPYLNFNGNTEEVFSFYKSVFGGEFSSLIRFSDFPEAGNVPEDAKNQIMHISLPLGPRNMLMGTDATESMGFKLITGNNISILLDVENEAEGDRLFRALSENGTVAMAMQKTFWGAYYGMCTDKYGIQWMINYTYETGS